MLCSNFQLQDGPRTSRSVSLNTIPVNRWPMSKICHNYHLFSIIADVQKRLQEEKDPEQRDLIEKQYVLLKIVMWQFNLNLTIWKRFFQCSIFSRYAKKSMNNGSWNIRGSEKKKCPFKKSTQFWSNFMNKIYALKD